jgi:hypothetical protein
MYGKNVLVRVAAVNEVAEYNDWSFLVPNRNSDSSSTAQEYLKELFYLPCVIKTSQNSLLSLPVVPSELSDKVDNGLSGIGAQESKNGWNWKIIPNENTTGSTTTLTQRKYGFRTPAKYVTNKNSRIIP